MKKCSLYYSTFRCGYSRTAIVGSGAYTVASGETAEASKTVGRSPAGLRAGMFTKTLGLRVILESSGDTSGAGFTNPRSGVTVSMVIVFL